MWSKNSVIQIFIIFVLKKQKVNSLERFGIEMCLQITTHKMNEYMMIGSSVLLWVQSKPHPPCGTLTPPCPSAVHLCSCWNYHSQGPHCL